MNNSPNRVSLMKKKMKNSSRNFIRNYRLLRTKLKQSWQFFHTNYRSTKQNDKKWENLSSPPPQTTEVRDIIQEENEKEQKEMENKNQGNKTW